MAGYTDSFTKINGDLIDADSFENEYAALDAAFNSTSGHTHNGTVAEGAFIPLISDTFNEVECGTAKISLSTDVGSTKTLQLTVEDGAILPAVTNDIDLGSASLNFKDIHSAGTANLTILNATGLASLDGGIDVDNTGSVFSVNGTSGNTLIAGTLGAGATTVTTLSAGVTDLTSVELTTGAIVSSILDDGTMAANSATALVTQASIVTYTAAEVAAAILDGGTY